MTTLTETLKKILNALAVADAGEYLSAGQKTHYLSRAMGQSVVGGPASTTQVAAASAPAGPGRRVALYMGSELPAEMMDYVIQTCARLKHGLTVLTFESSFSARHILEPYREMLTSAGMDLQLECLTGDPVRSLNRYLRSHPEIAFLACKDTGYLGRSFLNGAQRHNALPVPVVLLESPQEGARRSLDDVKSPARNTSSVA